MLVIRGDHVTAVLWNLDLPKCQGTKEIGSLYEGSVPYIFIRRAREYSSLCRGLRYLYKLESRLFGTTLIVVNEWILGRVSAIPCRFCRGG